MNYYELPNMQLWQCRSDALFGEYFCHNITPVNILSDTLEQKPYALLGFACDLGVKRNYGRTGARLAPDAIRKCLSRITIPQIKSCYDCGNIIVDDNDSLLSRQKFLAQQVSKIVKAGIRPIVLGGGHETAYGHYLGLLDAIHEDIAILNFDAHFDLREIPPDNEGNSGTPFRQIHNICMEQGRKFDYYCVGIQPLGNVNSLYEFAKQTNTTYLEAEVVNEQPQQVQELVKTILTRHKHVYLTICLDAFHYSYAPGVSAPQALGISPQVVINALKLLVKSNQVVSYDVVELNPNLDIDNHTARLAANLIAEFYY
jgi:formiminoglutamase